MRAAARKGYAAETLAEPRVMALVLERTTKSVRRFAQRGSFMTNWSRSRFPAGLYIRDRRRFPYRRAMRAVNDYAADADVRERCARGVFQFLAGRAVDAGGGAAVTRRE